MKEEAQFLKGIFAGQLSFEGIDDIDKFIKFFCDLYRIELFKDGLDLILTKVKQKHLRFEIKIIKGWDTNEGCFTSQPKSFYDQTLGKFIPKSELKITLRRMSYNVLAHEMAHAFAFESGINLGEDFRKAVGFDMKDRQPQIITLRAETKRLMVDALKSYKAEKFLSELFARYFELLSLSRDVCAAGDFATSDVMGFFENTTNFITKIFNPKIKAKIDSEVVSVTSEIARQVKLSAPEQKFQEKVESFHKKAANSWSKNVKSNAQWQLGWKKYQELEEEKKK